MATEKSSAVADVTPHSGAPLSESTRERLWRAVGPLMVLVVLGLWLWTRTVGVGSDSERGHDLATHGGTVVAFADGRLHAEAIVDQDRRLTIRILAADAQRPATVDRTSTICYLSQGSAAAIPVELQPEPAAGDPRGRTSRLVAMLPDEGLHSAEGGPLEVLIPELPLGGERFRVALRWGWDHGAMPEKVVDEAERALYLTPAGKYTEADIAANGRRTASEVFAQFRAEHDFRPQPGEQLCPITRTKAHAGCSWVIDGRRYEFCCPPCIDEFVQMAKDEPEQILPPASYVK